MYEDMTYEYLLQEKLSQISNDVDKREGSIIYDAMAGNSMESAMIYEAIDSVYKETNPETFGTTFIEYYIRFRICR